MSCESDHHQWNSFYHNREWGERTGQEVIGKITEITEIARVVNENFLVFCFLLFIDSLPRRLSHDAFSVGHKLLLNWHQFSSFRCILKTFRVSFQTIIWIPWRDPRERRNPWDLRQAANVERKTNIKKFVAFVKLASYNLLYLFVDSCDGESRPVGRRVTLIMVEPFSSLYPETLFISTFLIAHLILPFAFTSSSFSSTRGGEIESVFA